jgi:hypothetical protein
MIEVTVQRTSVNIEALDAQLRAALGHLTSGVSVSAGQVIVHLAETATPAHIETARAVAVAHDPAVLTPAQQTALQDRHKLEQARRDFGASELDLSTYQGKDPLLTLLAQKIAWLERELAALRPAAAATDTASSSIR